MKREPKEPVPPVIRIVESWSKLASIVIRRSGHVSLGYDNQIVKQCPSSKAAIKRNNNAGRFIVRVPEIYSARFGAKIPTAQLGGHRGGLVIHTSVWPRKPAVIKCSGAMWRCSLCPALFPSKPCVALQPCGGVKAACDASRRCADRSVILNGGRFEIMENLCLDLCLCGAGVCNYQASLGLKGQYIIAAA